MFLPEVSPNHDVLSAQPPVFRAAEPDFLIEASSAYPALDKLAIDARTSMWFAFRIFDPETPLYHPESQALGLSCWGELIAYKLDRGVQFRLLLTDFDPVVGDGLHEDAWRTVTALYNRKASSSAAWDIQVCPALHEARAGYYVRMLLAPAIYARINAKRHALNALPADERRDTFEYLRGYHRYLRLAGSGRVKWRSKLVLPGVHPVTHHHKVAVFDNEKVVLGGLDVNERRYDDPTHDRASIDTWHDISLTVTGAAATHVARYIASIWNLDYKAASRRMAQARKRCPRIFGNVTAPLKPLNAPEVNDTETGDTPMQIIRTASRNRGKFGFRMRPGTVNSGIEDAHFALINEAKTLLYIETQFFRHKPLAEALAARARECETLRLIMLLPAAPEEIAFDDENGLDFRFGERLQADCIEIVREAFGDRALFVCPALRAHKDSKGRDVVNDAPIIYVHAKVAIADDAWAIVGSANLNGRSLKWDSELGLLWQGDSAGDLRKRLATDWIDAEAADTPLDQVHELWQRVATENTTRPGASRRGFILPYCHSEADAMGVTIPLLPPEIV